MANGVPSSADSTSKKGGTGASLGGTGASLKLDMTKAANSHNEFDEILDLQTQYQVALQTYNPMCASKRGARIHDGPLNLRAARAPPDRSKWIREDKKYHPYSLFLESPAEALAATLTKKKRPKPPPKLWLPQTAEDEKILMSKTMKAESKAHRRAPRRRTVHEGSESEEEEDSDEDDEDRSSGEEGGSSASNAKPPMLAEPSKFQAAPERPPWDTEHHIMVSRANPEVQVYLREYFDKPLVKEGDGIPKVRQLYSMNDRQCGWNDEPLPLGQPRRTHLEDVGEYNIGGPKCQQLVSYWRKSVGRPPHLLRSLSEPFVGNVKVGHGVAMMTKTAPCFPMGEDKNGPPKQNILERLAQMPADESTEYWRGWAKYSKNRLPPEDPEE